MVEFRAKKLNSFNLEKVFDNKKRQANQCLRFDKDKFIIYSYDYITQTVIDYLIDLVDLSGRVIASKKYHFVFPEIIINGKKIICYFNRIHKFELLDENLSEIAVMYSKYYSNNFAFNGKNLFILVNHSKSIEVYNSKLLPEITLVKKGTKKYAFPCFNSVSKFEANSERFFFTIRRSDNYFLIIMNIETGEEKIRFYLNRNHHYGNFLSIDQNLVVEYHFEKINLYDRSNGKTYSVDYAIQNRNLWLLEGNFHGLAFMDKKRKEILYE